MDFISLVALDITQENDGLYEAWFDIFLFARQYTPKLKIKLLNYL